MKKIIVFIDGSNIYFAQKKSGFWLDWVKVKHYFEKRYCVLDYRYYVGLRQRKNNMRDFLNKLSKIGFTIITKPVKIVFDEKGQKFEKANFDVEITADMFMLSEKYDIAVLFSGDSDFVYLNEILNRIGKSLTVYSTRKTLAWELKLKTEHYFFEDIHDLTKDKRFIKL